jgi:DNA-binding MarR family transcriptional regulator
VKTVKYKSRSRRAPKNINPWSSVSPGAGRLRTEDFLTTRLHRLFHALRAEGVYESAPLELGTLEQRVLAVVADSSPMSFVEVTIRVGANKGGISRAITAMEERGLLRKAYLETPDERRFIKAPVAVSITSKGGRLNAVAIAAERARQARLLGSLSKGERTALWSSIDKLLDTVNRTEPPLELGTKSDRRRVQKPANRLTWSKTDGL